MATKREQQIWEMLHNGANPQEIVERLVKSGDKVEVAQRIVENQIKDAYKMFEKEGDY